MKTAEIIFLILVGLFGLVWHVIGFGRSEAADFTLPVFLLLLYLSVKVFILSDKAKARNAEKEEEKTGSR